MKKRLVPVLVVVILLLVGASLAFPLLVDPNAYKQEIASWVKRKTGRDLQVAGDIKPSLFPWIGLSLADVTLNDAPGFGDAPLIRVGRLEVRAKWSSLLSGQPEVERIVVDGLALKLVRNADGMANWETLAPIPPPEDLPRVTPAPQDSQPAGATKTPATSLPPAFALGGMEIRNAQVTWHDAARNTGFTLTGLHLTSGTLTAGQPVRLELATEMASDPPALQGRASLTTTMRATTDQIVLTGIDALFEASGANAAISAVRLQGALDLSKARVTSTGLTGSLRAMGKPGAPFGQLDLQYQGDIQGDPANLLLRLPDMNLTLRAQGGTLPPEGVSWHLAAVGEWNGRARTAQLSGCRLKGPERVEGECALNATGLGEQPVWSGELALREFDLRALLAKMGQPLSADAGDKTFTSMRLQGSFQTDAKRLHISRLEAHLDDSVLRGTLSWPLEAPATVQVTLDIDQLDLRRYRPAAAPQPTGTPPAGAGQEPPSATAAVRTSGEKAPVSLMQRVDLDGKLHVGTLQVGEARIQELQLTAQAKNGVTHLSPVTLTLFGGSSRIDATLNAQATPPAVTWKQTLQGVQLGPLLTALADGEHLTGKADLELDLTAAGLDRSAIERSLNGRLAFVVREGAYPKTDLTHAIRKAYGVYATAKGKPFEVGQDSGRTPFTTLEGRAEIRNGILETRDLKAESPAFGLTGAGTVDLPGRQIDLATRVNPLAALSDVNSRTLNDLKGMTIPVRVHGEVARPRVTIDPAALAGEAVKTKVMEKIQEKLGDPLRGTPLGEGLKKWLPFGK
ncbi:MAG: AsmA family protein [Magnetococcales bacterium]|nr:AsmA family protein [Magnetococcales bacterium]